MNNTIKRSYAAVVTQVAHAIAGVEQHATDFTLGLVSAEAMNTNLDLLTAGETTTKQSKAELRTRQLALQAATVAARNYLFSAKDVLKTHLGKKYSSAWDEAGFLHSLQVPQKEDQVVSHLLTLNAYFAAHPGQENAPLNVTAAQAVTLRTALIAARTALNSQKTTWQLAMTARNGKLEQSREHLRALLKELAIRLTPLDERWASFGFNKPGQLRRPDMPKNVTAVLIGTNAIAMRWDAAPRAKYYRIWKKVIGVDVEFVPAGNPGDLDFTLDGLPSNSIVEVQMAAVNNGGESIRTEPIAVQTL